MSQSPSFNLVIANPDEVIFEGEANRVIAPGINQEIAVLPDHTPLYAQLVKGVISVDTIDGQNKTFDIEGGIVRVKDNQVSIITGFNPPSPK